MGLPRSNLVKKPAPAPVAIAAPAVPASGVGALEVATTLPQLNLGEGLPAPNVPVPAASAEPIGDVDAGADIDHGPSTHDLLERAARLGPPRMTFESIVLPNDPILQEKMQPHAAERRARFRKIVKATLGACVAVCVAALVASAFSSGEGSDSSSSSASAGVSARTAPASAIVSLEKLDIATRGKAIRVTSANVTARAKLPKRR